MRFRFVKGKQKELINKFKNFKNFTWNELANFLKIKFGRLKAYSEETSLLPKEIYFELDIEKNYFKFIIERMDDNWGKRKGGKNSFGSTKKIKIPEDSKDLAEFYGVMLGDGNSHKTSFYKSRTNKRGTYMIRIVGDSRLDKNYLINYIKPLIEKLFDVKVRVGIFKNTNVMFLEAHGCQLINFLEDKGFKPGNKIINQLGIPNWIKDNSKYLSICLRGLYDTDGSVYKSTNQNSHQICFTSSNKTLMNDVRISLLELGINCSKISNKDVYITKKIELRKFLKLIGFNNNRHLKKVKMWKLDSPLV